MTYTRPGSKSYVLNDGSSPGTLLHNQPAVLASQPGIVQKVVAADATDGLAAQSIIQTNERCLLVQSGVVEITYTDSTALGTGLYIKKAPTVTDGARAFAVSTTNDNTTVPFGVVVENASSGRGTAAGKVRVNLSLRDTLTNTEA